MEGNDGQEGPSSERQRRAAPPATGAPAPAAAAAAALVFPRGAIKRIRVHNFMTYSNTVEIKPGPRLNLVLGPNGTGKSSLVCAICIGLGGRPQLLGRADNLRDFIRRGCDDAWTEITLSGGPGCTDWLVRRDIRIVSGHGYSSKWRLNQREVNQSEVQGLVSELNIQFENLCQFLPQDRVVEFARMDPLQLLEATQKAIGDSTLSDKHKQVIAKSKEAKTLTVSLAALKARLTKLEDENRALERDAERFKRRQQLKRDLADIGTKEVWLEVGSKEADLERDELALCSSKEMLQRFKDEAADDAAPLKQARQRHKSAKDELQRLGAPPNSQTLAARRRKLMEDIEKHSNEHVTLQDRIGNLQQRSDQLRAETAEAQRVLTAAQRAFSELPPTVDHSAAIAALQDESAELLDKVINMDFNQRTLEDRQTALRGQRVKIMQAMAALDSTRTRRLQAMDRNKPGLAGLHHWLEDVKRRGGVLQGPAFGPLGLEVTLRDALSHAKVIDAACGDMLLAFAVTCRADEEVMSAEIKRRGMDGVTVHVMDQPLDTPYKQFSGPASNYRSFGVQSTLADLVDAPPLVMQALTSAGPALACSLFVPNESKIDELMRQPRVQTVFSLSAQFRVIKGSYGGSNARQAQDLGQPKYLGGGGAADPQAKEREQAALAEADAELADVERELGELGVARSQLDGQLKGVEGRREQLQAEQRQSLQQHNLLNRNMIAADKEYARKRATPDPLRSKPDMEAQQARAVEKHFEASIALMRLVRTQWEGVRERGVLELVLREAEMQVQALEGASSERKEREKALKDKVSKLQQLVARSKSKVEQARKQAQLEAPLTDEISARLEQLPDDMAVLAEKRSELEAKVAGIMCNNPRALEEFRERSAKISELRADVGGDEGALAALTSEIEDIKSTWLPELERVVARINTAFGAAFQEIGCAGEVHLNHAEGDYEKFAIEIMVKFRDNEELQLLTGTRQSGGERSVSTILYLLALQGVTVTPFRVVDEINQGMDPLNERKVFGQLVAASTREGTPQCFLLTPKLLPDLDYSASITVLMVMNGGLEDANGAAPAATWPIAQVMGSTAMAAARG